jgi:hypothetical protein
VQTLNILLLFLDVIFQKLKIVTKKTRNTSNFCIPQTGAKPETNGTRRPTKDIECLGQEKLYFSLHQGKALSFRACSVPLFQRDLGLDFHFHATNKCIPKNVEKKKIKSK